MKSIDLSETKLIYTGISGRSLFLEKLLIIAALLTSRSLETIAATIAAVTNYQASDLRRVRS